MSRDSKNPRSSKGRRNPRSEAKKKARENSDTEYGGLGAKMDVNSLLSALVPEFIAKKYLSVTIETDKDVYEAGETVEARVGIKNNLPVPVEITTPKQRIWGWKFNGLLEASEENLYTPEKPNQISFRGREVKQMDFKWNGKIRRERSSGTEWVLPKRGKHELQAFVAIEGDKPTDKKSIEIR